MQQLNSVEETPVSIPAIVDGQNQFASPQIQENAGGLIHDAKQVETEDEDVLTDCLCISMRCLVCTTRAAVRIMAGWLSVLV